MKQTKFNVPVGNTDCEKKNTGLETVTSPPVNVPDVIYCTQEEQDDGDTKTKHDERSSHHYY